MIRFPRNHIADETVARIMVAAKRVRSRAKEPELAPDDLELVDLPPSLMPAQPVAALQAPAGAPAAEVDPASVPPLEETGLDPGLVLAGADSFDALLKT